MDDVRCSNDGCNIPDSSTLPVSSALPRRGSIYPSVEGETAQANRPIDSSLPLIFHLANTDLRRATDEPEIPVSSPRARIKRASKSEPEGAVHFYRPEVDRGIGIFLNVRVVYQMSRNDAGAIRFISRKSTSSPFLLDLYSL